MPLLFFKMSFHAIKSNYEFVLECVCVCVCILKYTGEKTELKDECLLLLISLPYIFETKFPAELGADFQ